MWGSKSTSEREKKAVIKEMKRNIQWIGRRENDPVRNGWNNEDLSFFSPFFSPLFSFSLPLTPGGPQLAVRSRFHALPCHCRQLFIGQKWEIKPLVVVVVVGCCWPGPDLLCALDRHTMFYKCVHTTSPPQQSPQRIDSVEFRKKRTQSLLSTFLDFFFSLFFSLHLLHTFWLFFSPFLPPIYLFHWIPSCIFF